MEKKQLNLSKPLLSARRCSQNSGGAMLVRPPHYRSELKSGPVGNPAAIPFHWERIPGRPKVEAKQPPARYLKAESDGDADRLSRTESFFSSSSVSGVEGGKFSADLQTREVLMDRFLPAAKAMANETARYGPKRQPVVVRELKGMTGCAEESDDDCDHLGTAYGLLSRFCLRNSVMNVGVDHKMQRSRSSDVEELRQRETLGCPNKGFKTFRELLADVDEVDLGGSIVEKEVGKMRSPAAHNIHNTTAEDFKKPNAIDNESCGTKTPTTSDSTQKVVAVKPNLHEKWSSEFLLLPLLPKSPSDSWLWRTLPQQPTVPRLKQCRDVRHSEVQLLP